MYHDARKKTVKWLIIALACVIAVVAGIIIFSGIQSREMLENGAVAIKETVTKAAKQCYVVEGVYPPNLEYLQEHYGLTLNTRDYYVTYDAFASNQPPTIRVTVRGNK